MKNYKVIITIDGNDRDTMEESFNTTEAGLSVIRSYLSKIDKRYSFSKEDSVISDQTKATNPGFSDADWEWFEDFMPDGGELTQGYATLDGVIVVPIGEEEVLF